jgi:hypothetical protein
MKYLTFSRHAESFRGAAPRQALMEVMGKFIQRSLRCGVLVDAGRGAAVPRRGARRVFAFRRT